MNNTAAGTFASVTALTLSIFLIIRNVILSHFSYVQVPRIKLKVEHLALVLFYIIKIGLAHWKGWRDEKQKCGEHRENEEHGIERDKSRGKKRRRRNMIIRKRKYIIVLSDPIVVVGASE
jgi:hypothetical protein